MPSVFRIRAGISVAASYECAHSSAILAQRSRSAATAKVMSRSKPYIRSSFSGLPLKCAAQQKPSVEPGAVCTSWQPHSSRNRT